MDTDTETDEVLLTRVRDDGDVEAFGLLYERHAGAVRRFARSLCANGADADDLTAEVFTGLLASLGRGKGPTQLALPYLFASIKHRHWRTSGQRAHETALTSTSGISATCVANDIVEAEVVRTALSTLPDDVQAMLWRAEVDEESVHDAADRDATSAHNVAVLRHRARRALGTAYLAQHSEPDGGLAGLDPECQANLPHLASLVRNKVGARRRRRLEQHLAVCPRCSETRQRLQHLNTKLRVTPRLPWNVWSAGVTTTIKTQVAGWLGTSAITLAGPTVLAAAVLVPAVALMDRVDDPESAAAAATSPFERHAPTGTDGGWAGRTERPEAQLEQRDDAGASTWFAAPSPSPAPSSEPAPITSEPAPSVPAIHPATTSEPLSPAEVSPSASHRDDVAVEATAPDTVPAAVPSADRTPIGQAALDSDADRPDADDQSGGRDEDEDSHGASGGGSSGAKERSAGGRSSQASADGPGQGSATDEATGTSQNNGQGNGNGIGNGNGPENGNRNGSDQAKGSGNGNGNGMGQGSANGQTNGNGQGSAHGQGQRSGGGHGAEQAVGMGPDPATGHAAATDQGNGNGNGNGQSNANANANANANGQGNGKANGHAKQAASVPVDDEGGEQGDDAVALDTPVAVTGP